MASRSVGKSKARAAAVEQFGDLALGQFQHRQHHGVIRLRFGADDLDDVRNDPPFIPLRLIDTLEFDIDKIDDVVCAFSTLQPRTERCNARPVPWYLCEFSLFFLSFQAGKDARTLVMHPEADCVSLRPL